MMAHAPARGQAEALIRDSAAAFARGVAQGRGWQDQPGLPTPQHRFGTTAPLPSPAMGAISSGGNTQGYPPDSETATMLNVASNTSLQRANPRSPISHIAQYTSSRNQDAAQGRAVSVNPLEGASPYEDAVLQSEMAPRGQGRHFWATPATSAGEQTPRSHAAAYGGSSSGAGSAAGRFERNSPQFQASPLTQFHAYNGASMSAQWGIGASHLEDDGDASSSDEGKIGTE